MIRRIAFPDRRQIDKQIGNIFLQVLLPVLVDHRQMLQPRSGAGVIKGRLLQLERTEKQRFTGLDGEGI